MQNQEFKHSGFHKEMIIGSLKKEEIRECLFLYYPYSRYETSAWLSDSIKTEFGDQSTHYGAAKFNTIQSSILKQLKSWLMDVVLDRELYEKQFLQLPVIPKDGSEIPNAPTLPALIGYEGPNHTIIEQFNSTLTQVIRAKDSTVVSARVGLGPQRHRTISVFTTDAAGQERKVAPQLEQLSSGELMILGIVAGILRSNMALGNLPSQLSEIEGLVLIDEVDLHLHIGLQRRVLPMVLKLFPKVQFVLTTHSPFFLMGMEESGAVDIYELPSGFAIGSSEFTEFGEAFETFVSRNDDFKSKFEELSERVSSAKRVLVVTEGKTDWRHLKRALSKMKKLGKFENLNLEFAEQEEDMGDSELERFFLNSKRIPSDRPVICLFDRDNPQYIRKYGSSDEGYILEGKAAAACISVPENRKDRSEISIEHLYDDEALLTCVSGTEKRLRFHSEVAKFVGKPGAFIRSAPALQTDKIYDTDVDKLGLEDGSQEGDLAISKHVFFERLVDTEVGDTFDLSGFEPTLCLLQKIASKMADS